MSNILPPPRTNYSTTEQVIGTWTTGKPLYRKVYTGTFGTISGSSETNLTVNLGSTYKVRMLYGSAEWVSGSNKGIICGSYYQSSNNYCSFGISNNNISLQLKGSHYSNCPYTIIIEYTKTTD